MAKYVIKDERTLTRLNTVKHFSNISDEIFYDEQGVIYHKKDDNVFKICQENVGEHKSKTIIRLKVNNQYWVGTYKTYILAHIFVPNPSPETYKWVAMIDEDGEVEPSNLKWVGTRVLHNPGWKKPVYVYYEDNSVREFESMKQAGTELGINPQTISKQICLKKAWKGLYFSKEPVDIEKVREELSYDKRRKTPQVF